METKMKNTHYKPWCYALSKPPGTTWLEIHAASSNKHLIKAPCYRWQDQRLEFKTYV